MKCEPELCEKCEEKDNSIECLEKQNCELQKENEKLRDQLSEMLGTELLYMRVLDYVKLNHFLATGKSFKDHEIAKAIRGY